MTTAQNGTTSLEDSPTIISTTDEDGQQHYFQMIDLIEVEGQAYGLMLYLGETEDNAAQNEEGYEEEVVVMRIVDEDGEYVFESIDDDKEFDRVINYIETLDDDEEEEDTENN